MESPFSRGAPGFPGSPERWGVWGPYRGPHFQNDVAGGADQVAAARARPAATAVGGEGRPHPEHGVADRVGPGHALAAHARPDRGRPRRADRDALRGPARGPRPGGPPEGLTGRLLRRDLAA